MLPIALWGVNVASVYGRKLYPVHMKLSQNALVGLVHYGIMYVSTTAILTIKTVRLLSKQDACTRHYHCYFFPIKTGG